MKSYLRCASVVLVLLSTACAHSGRGPDVAAIRLLPDLGDHHYAVTTRNAQSQRFFDQGLILAYAFNHAEAAKAFREAARLDPSCAICYWGQALVLGPNINAPMDAAAVPEAYRAARRAVSLSEGSSERERMLIEALAKRYAPRPAADRSSLDRAYAEAMKRVAERYPNDADVLTLYAEALMDLHPWDYWGRDGTPRSWTPEIVATLEKALDVAPLHPGANHLYIHAMEASPTPEKALASADRLRDLVPGAGHLVHMPAHIYIRTGRYQQAVLANELAVEADHDYLHDHHAEGIYPLAYVPHNHHFLMAAASFAGRGKDAVEAARATAAHVDVDAMRQPDMATLEHYYAMPLYALARFGRWSEILAEPRPDADLRYANAVWHYARGLAYTGNGDLDKARMELDRLKSVAKEEKIAEMSIWDLNAVRQILDIAAFVLEGEIAARRGETADAVAALTEAVRLEDELKYTEPSDWYFPARQSLGAVLLAAGNAAQAEAVYREDLEKNPENGWSLFGLMQSLAAQNRTSEAAAVKARFEKAWEAADVELTASRIM